MTDLNRLTLGRRIQALRKEAALTQEALAERMGVTPQAVSKWENDLSCPDILSLPRLAKELHTTVDTLLTGDTPAPGLPAVPVKKPEELIVRTVIVVEEGDRFNINLPFTVFRLAAMYDMLEISVGVKDGDATIDDFLHTLANMDLKRIVRMIEAGARGVLVDAGTDNHLTLWVE